jgi:hypothetical protein
MPSRLSCLTAQNCSATRFGDDCWCELFSSHLCQYDLRAVLVHDGLFGRRQLYSYVKDKGTWWKTVDTDVTEVGVLCSLMDLSLAWTTGVGRDGFV